MFAFVDNHILFCVCHRPVVHRELCVPWLDALARIQLLKLLAGVVTKSMFSRHFRLNARANLDPWLGRDRFFTPTGFARCFFCVIVLDGTVVQRVFVLGVYPLAP